MATMGREVQSGGKNEAYSSVRRLHALRQDMISRRDLVGARILGERIAKIDPVALNKQARLPGQEQDWGLLSACKDVDPDVFFLPPKIRAKKRDELNDEAKAVCACCPVTGPCLKEALDKGKEAQDHGVRGRMTQAERIVLLNGDPRKNSTPRVGKRGLAGPPSGNGKR